MKTAQEKQGYRVHAESPVCRNCKHREEYGHAMSRCSIGKFSVHCNFGNCPQHEWRK